MRKVKEWIGKTDDAMPPPYVRLRIFDTHKGICHFSGRKIRAGEAWELHHVEELWEGGENRESNLAPALRGLHRAHSAKQQSVKAESDRKRSKHLGLNRRKGRGFRGWTRFDGTPVWADDRKEGEGND